MLRTKEIINEKYLKFIRIIYELRKTNSFTNSKCIKIRLRLELKLKKR
jgi:hypothetical protein